MKYNYNRQQGEFKISRCQYDEIKTMMETILNQQSKNNKSSQWIQQFMDINDLINTSQFVEEVKARIRQPQSPEEYKLLKMEIQNMLDQLLNEEYNLDKLITRIKSKRQRRTQSKPQEQVSAILNPLDTNTIEKIEKIEKMEKMDLHIGSQTCRESHNIRAFTKKEQQPNINILDNMNNRVKQMIDHLNFNNQQIEDNELEKQIDTLQKELDEIKENKLYQDENVEIYCVYKENIDKSRVKLSLIYEQE